MKKTKVQCKIANRGTGHEKHSVLNDIHHVYFNRVMFFGIATAEKAFTQAESKFIISSPLDIQGIPLMKSKSLLTSPVHLSGSITGMLT